ncbi:Outer membrane protein assembly factor BamB, contains PQQ-like beta-propeller repeat [Blastococcus aggregatus]|uniref:Outer membrane protein assembly factor BamB, contains PQQ-like beta-propeller repeat n=1 Tax=Blastococcus aggregatus TaxID=38502 RepID=A0A285V492_9ACTN|nr:PQQ-binding-like beta-propeller repeat protein [Blastococcus aggregatus]SOC48869.1 Outer membrane protein assembly factor BamB, contains PQQ-like beta-propeller repeat [Blastococcus aggregatus]
MQRSTVRPPLRVWVWIAATLAVVVVAALLWRGSEAAATDSTTAAPAGVPAGAPAGDLSPAWSAGGRPPADVVEEGRVLLGSDSGVRALDPLTGDEAWHYTRSNARLCGLTVTDGVAVAVFRTADRCDEAVALDAATGVRTWTRNLSLRGDAVLTSTASIVLATSPTGVLTFDPVGNNVRWRAGAPGGCTWLSAVAGDTGVAVLQRCAGAQVVQLRLYDGFDGSEHWTVDVPVPEDVDVALLGADALVGLRVGGEVRLFAPDGAALRATLPAAPGDTVQQTTAAGLVLVRVGGTLSAVDPAGGAVRWTAPADGLPAATGADGPEVVVPTADGFVRRDARTGDELGRWAAGEVPPDGTATVVGPAVVLRLADEVRTYR